MPPNLDTGQLLVWLSFFRSQCPGPGSGGVLSYRSCALVPLSGSWGALCGGPYVGTLGYRAPGSAVPILTTLSCDSLAPHSPARLWQSSAALNHRKEKQSHQVGTAAVCFFSAAALASVTSGCDGPTSWGCPVSWGAGLCSWGPSPLLLSAGVIPSPLCVADHLLCTRAYPRRWGLAANKSDPSPCDGELSPGRQRQSRTLQTRPNVGCQAVVRSVGDSAARYLQRERLCRGAQ